MGNDALAESEMVLIGVDVELETSLSWKWVATLQLIAVGGGGAFLFGFLLRLPLTPMRLVGMSLATISFVLWATARVQLGESFSVKPKAIAIVSRGIYSKIRNPIYVFSALWVVGFILALGKPTWLLILVLLVPMQVARARREARLLEDTFGDAYREYRKRTWF
jgi:protein-S-isoprenylcysteine O-methyltransferase Ste14